jgi:D-xylose transport system substrate-binding protein
VKKLIALAALAAVTTVVTTATTASAHVTRAKASIDVGVLLPDTKSSPRWQTQDAPDLAKAFKAAGLTAKIVNAEASATTQKTQADAAIANGAKVLLLVNLDSASGAAIEAAAAKQGVKVIDYDRLTLGGSASYYVSFNNVTVGKLQGQGLVKCLKASGEYSKHPVVAELNGAPTDNNATLFANGYNSVLGPLYKSGVFKKGPNQSVPNWDPVQALTIFNSMLTKTSDNIQAVASANDTLGNSVIQDLKSHKLPSIPVTGQDATAQGVQSILAGDQCMTVYKAVPKEAAAAAKLAISLVKGGKPVGINGSTSNGKRKVPSVLLTPQAITKANYKILFAQGYLKKSDVCNGAYAKFCK